MHLGSALHHRWAAVDIPHCTIWSPMPNYFAETPVRPLILELLSRRNWFDPQRLVQIEETIRKAKAGTLSEVALIRAGHISEQEVASVYADDLFLPVVNSNIEAGAVEKELGGLLPEKLCVDRLICPMALRDNVLDVAFVSPEEMGVVDELQLMTGLRINPMIAPLSVVESRLDMLYRSNRESKAIGEGSEDFDAHEEVVDNDNENILDLDVTPPADANGRIIRMVNQILEQALRNRASDIHLEPFEDGCKFRLRIDGVLHELPPPSKSVFIMIVSRFKVLAKMDIAEKRVPQDGAIALRTGDKRIDLRVNTVPTVHGEKMVMRILDKAAIPLELTGLGLDERQSKDLIESIQSPYGLALVTGPTGSGKSTTLYSCLNKLNDTKVNICTVEDPVEYKFKGMNQVQVKAQVGLTFSSALRAFLRQDPDIIMVGEVRDQETAEICLRAALTGHFVLSTIHTNDALSAVTRLQDMGIEPFLLSCALRVLEAQRLVRRLCPSCKEPYELSAELAEHHRLTPGEILYRPKGCLQCRRLGYRGRIGVFEVVRITSRLTQLIQQRAPLDQLRKAAREEGMKMLFDSALDKARQGLTSLEAALSVTMAED
jgi:type IV pilus assembly protein PilB